jgi:hypothetical protein
LRHCLKNAGFCLYHNITTFFIVKIRRDRRRGLANILPSVLKINLETAGLNSYTGRSSACRIHQDSAY